MKTGRKTEIASLLERCDELTHQVIKYHNHRESKPYDPTSFNNRNPLAPFIGTICDQQIGSEIAWDIPEHLHQWMGLPTERSLSPSRVSRTGRLELRSWLEKHMQDKWPSGLRANGREKWVDNISEYVTSTCQRIELEYCDDPDAIFAIDGGRLSVPLVYFLLRQFPGVGPKKATMIARDFGRDCDWLRSVRTRLAVRGIEVAVECSHFTEMPIDVHVTRVFGRLGFARYGQPQDFQNLARLVYPDNPGLVDDYIWDLGRSICRNPPNCPKCTLSSICESYRDKRSAR